MYGMVRYFDNFTARTTLQLHLCVTSLVGMAKETMGNSFPEIEPNTASNSLYQERTTANLTMNGQRRIAPSVL